MSDHNDTKNKEDNPRVDVTDAYATKGTDGVACFMNLGAFSQATEFDHDAVYAMNFDVTGDGTPDLVLRAEFGTPDSSGRQSVILRLATGHIAATLGSGGVIVAAGHTGDIITGAGGLKLYAGPAADPFYIEPSIVTAVATAVQTGTALDLTDFDPSTAHNLFGGYNVLTIVAELPITRFTVGHRIGFWASTSVPLDDGSSYRQIDRAANPLVSTLFGLTGADDFTGMPADDLATYGARIYDMTARVAAAQAKPVADPQAHAAKVRDALLPDTLRYTWGDEAHWYAAPPPGEKYARDGRDLTGNHPKEMYELVLGISPQVLACLTAADATGTLRAEFPYLSEPV